LSGEVTETSEARGLSRSHVTRDARIGRQKKVRLWGFPGESPDAVDAEQLIIKVKSVKIRM
jgi:hypothetical protein